MTHAAQGPQVSLVEIEDEMLEPIFRWYEDPDLVAPFDRYETEDFESFRRSVRSAGTDPRSLAPRYAIVHRESGRLLGCVGHYIPHPIFEYVDVWYLLGESAERGRGYGSEAVGLLVDLIFRTTTVERVGATCDVENVASSHLAERVGMHLQGTLALALFHHARWHDVRVYAVTRSEWARTHPRA